MMLKKINNILIILMIVSTIIISLTSNSIIDFSRIASYLSILLLIIIPLLLKKTKFKLEEKDRLIFIIFMFIADFLGCIARLYKYVWWFDIFVHYSFGIVTFLSSIFILRKIEEYDSKRLLFNVLFIFGVIGMCASLWEILEFSVDTFTGSNLQHYKETGVKDTMEDIIVAFLGGLTILPIYLNKIKRKND